MRNVHSIYQIFVRNYSKEGTLYAVAKDLNRIRAMGFDYIYLLPIHPIGIAMRKGTYGSPYAVQDYMAVDKELGTMSDFLHLIKAAHAKGLKVMMDIVIHHSAVDHSWVKTHGSYYAADNAVAAWSDVKDFDFKNEQLQDALLRMLVFWAEKGVDGMRCDVASLVPVTFWEKARSMCRRINPRFLLLAESVEAAFILQQRAAGHIAMSDGELASAFDDLYPYSIREEFEAALRRKELLPYERSVNHLIASLPESTNEVWYLENHDRPRIYKQLGENRCRALNWLAYSFLIPGTAFVYNGQETWALHAPQLFEKDPIDWTKTDPRYMKLVAQYNALRHTYMPLVQGYRLYENERCLEVYAQRCDGRSNFGGFNVNGCHGEIDVHLADGVYRNLLNQEEINVVSQKIDSRSFPYWIEV